MMRGQPYDSRADVFSLGAMLYLMLTYHPPFYAPTKEQIIEKNRACVVDFNFNNWEHKDLNISEETIDLLKWMMKKDPAQRMRAHQA